MTQKSNLFKGQKKKQSAANNHGKALKIRKGKTFKPPNKKSDEFVSGKEVTKFINKANEMKAATVAAKDGAVFQLLKVAKEQESSKPGKKKKGK